LVVVFGAGGDLYPGMRSVMGLFAAELGYLSFVTSYIPLNEDPLRIAAEI
jgi:UDP-N-acetylmuramyl tripeptide synthase